jgi:Na+-transporting NADH:ubiquinone oxidoreductase subunit C
VDRSKRESIGNVLFVAVAVCLIASIVVSATAVMLKPAQQRNAELDRQRNILEAAGMLPAGRVVDAEGRGVAELFAQFETRVVDLRTGEFTDVVDPATYDQLRAARSPETSQQLARNEDVAGIRRREHYALVYVLRDEAGGIGSLVLPIRGSGLWGTMFGFLALESDFETVAGLTFYDHQETPGLGGEVDNPRWKAQWPGVELFDDAGDPAVRLVKTRSPADSQQAEREVDALAGATLTTRGVEHTIRFWMGDFGFGPFLQRLSEEGE